MNGDRMFALAQALQLPRAGKMYLPR